MSAEWGKAGSTPTPAVPAPFEASAAVAGGDKTVENLLTLSARKSKAAGIDSFIQRNRLALNVSA
jgi:hypothetical protein